jgi:hypothetical protein
MVSPPGDGVEGEGRGDHRGRQGGKQADWDREAGSELLDDLPLACGIGTGRVEAELVERSPGLRSRRGWRTFPSRRTRLRSSGGRFRRRTGRYGGRARRAAASQPLPRVAPPLAHGGAEGAGRRPLPGFPPPRQRSLSSSSRSRTSPPQGGYDVPRLFQTIRRVDKSAEVKY